MQHSIAARFAARPAARFVRPSARARERRLGLRPMGSFRPASATLTVLRRADLGPLVQLHAGRSEEHTSELQSHSDLVCRLLLEKKKQKNQSTEKVQVFPMTL